MSEQILKVMAVGLGDKEYRYDTDDDKSVKKVIDVILDKIRLGWVLYGAKEGNELVRIADFSIVEQESDKQSFLKDKLEELDRFIMDKEIKRRVLAAPQVGG